MLNEETRAELKADICEVLVEKCESLKGSIIVAPQGLARELTELVAAIIEIKIPEWGSNE